MDARFIEFRGYVRTLYSMTRTRLLLLVSRGKGNYRLIYGYLLANIGMRMVIIFLPLSVFLCLV